MRETTGRNARQVAEAQKYAAEHAVDLRTIELDDLLIPRALATSN
jgi:hypothetical protein